MLKKGKRLAYQLTCSMRLSARRAKLSRLAGLTGGNDDGNGGVDMIKYLLQLFYLDYLLSISCKTVTIYIAFL